MSPGPRGVGYENVFAPITQRKPSSLFTPKVQLPLVGMVMMPVASVTKLSRSTLIVNPGKVKSPPKFAPLPVFT